MKEEPQFRKLTQSMEKALKPERFEHSVGVAYTAAALGMRYDEDVNRCLVAGILHDCAKCLDHEEQLKICRKHDLPVQPAELSNKKLLHASVGAYLAEHKYGITDPEILTAIRWHTTGKPDMTILEKIIFLADIIEPNRKHFTEMDLLRRTIFDDLDKGMALTLEHLLIYLKKSGEEIDPMTESAWRFYNDRK